MRPFHCGACGQIVFFENTHCDSCGAELGYSPSRRDMLALPPDADPAQARPCAERTRQGCNWLVDPEDPQAQCVSCRLTRVIPDLSLDANLAAWKKIEQAKKRLVLTLLELGLPPEPKQDADDPWGLAFELRAHIEGAPPVLTGHANGVITLNVAEADDVKREAARVALDEPMRTLLGHLRHEIGHYLQYRWLANEEEAMRLCREVFGDERADYPQALARHRAEGPPAEWKTRFISAYASAHPWEDWAETCAHTLLVIDAVKTAAGWGLRLDSPAATTHPQAPSSGQPLEHVVLTHWLPVAQFLNAMNRCLGLHDSYPFLMPDAVLKKMNAVQDLLRRAAEGRAAAAGRDAPTPPQSGLQVAQREE